MKYFTIAELCKSETAGKQGIDNRCKAEHVVTLTALVDNVLDPLREAYGKPIKINSGYRSLALNRALKSKDTSHHVRGMAADISGGSKAENKKLFNMIRSMKLPFTQLIDENNFQWVHVSYDPNDVRMQVLKL